MQGPLPASELPDLTRRIHDAYTVIEEIVGGFVEGFLCAMEVYDGNRRPLFVGQTTPSAYSPQMVIIVMTSSSNQGRAVQKR